MNANVLGSTESTGLRIHSNWIEDCLETPIEQCPTRIHSLISISVVGWLIAGSGISVAMWGSISLIRV